MSDTETSLVNSFKSFQAYDIGICVEQAGKTEETEEKSDKAPEGEQAEPKDAEEDKKAKLQKKSKISVDVGADLQVNDVLDPSIDAIESSKKK